MITDSEVDKVYDTLRGTLQETGFSWVAAQVAREIRLGKTESKKIRTTERDEPEEFLLDNPIRTGKPEMFTSSVEYTPKERLELLLAALEHASIEVAEVHDATIHI